MKWLITRVINLLEVYLVKIGIKFNLCKSSKIANGYIITGMLHQTFMLSNKVNLAAS